MKKLIAYLQAGLFALLIASPVLAVTSPVTSPVSAADCERRILGIPPWYRGLTSGDDCAITGPNSFEQDGQNLTNFISKIALNIIEIVLVLTAYISGGYILYGGFRFLTGGAMPEQVAKARKTILQAVIGLAISLGAVGIVNLIFGILG